MWRVDSRLKTLDPGSLFHKAEGGLLYPTPTSAPAPHTLRPKHHKVMSSLVWVQALNLEELWMLKICSVQTIHSLDKFAILCFFFENYPFMVVDMSKWGPFWLLVIRSVGKESVHLICSQGTHLSISWWYDIVTLFCSSACKTRKPPSSSPSSLLLLAPFMCPGRVSFHESPPMLILSVRNHY